jgi:hypothetical protein
VSLWENSWRGLAEGIERNTPSIADAVRAYYRDTYGECRRCHAPLSGRSPTQTCAECHADEVLGKAKGDEPPAEA